jgi:hypothetical protein
MDTSPRALPGRRWASGAAAALNAASSERSVDQGR